MPYSTRRALSDNEIHYVAGLIVALVATLFTRPPLVQARLQLAIDTPNRIGNM
jgi:hypothetical protein